METEAKITNPKGYNQHIPDPRQQLFITNYINPESPTFSNCKQSAIKAGYDSEYAEQITSRMPTWLIEKVRHPILIQKAEKNIDKFLSDDFKEDNKIKADVTKFTLDRLAKAWKPKASENNQQGLVNIELNIRQLSGKSAIETSVKEVQTSDNQAII